MQITFDPHNAQECMIVRDMLSGPIHATSGSDMDPVAGAPDQPDTAAPAETPRADGLTATEQPEPTTPDQPDTSETDCHGMTHDDAIHSTPASKNADGSWRAKRGQKEAYEAAIAAATGKDAPAPAPQGMPVPQPASAAPATPPAPIDYNTMAERFMAKMADPDGLPAEYEAIYTALSIGYDDLETNQTSIARLSAYMDAVDNGENHDGCVRHAMSAD